MQINIIRYDGCSHKSCDCHPVAILRNLESEESRKDCAPVGLCCKCAYQEDHTHEHDERCQEVLHSLIASGEKKRKRDDTQ